MKRRRKVKKKSVFAQIMILVAVALVGLVLTVCMALLAGSVETSIFDWRNLNLANMIPILIIGGFITCVVVGIAVIVVSRSIFYRVRDYLFENQNNQNNKGDKEP